MESWVMWLIAAVILMIGEITITGFFLAPLAIGAMLALPTDLLTDNWLIPWIVFAIGTAIGYGLLRPIAKKHLSTPPEIRTGTAALVGHTATVTQDVDNDRNQGAIRLDEGEVWTARAEDGGAPLPAGSRVTITEIRGATAVVAAID